MNKNWTWAFLVMLLSTACSIVPKNSNNELVSEPQTSSIDSEIQAPIQASKSSDWSASYIGVRGYFNRPPAFETPADQNNFQRCSPFIITGFTRKSDRLVMTVLQANNTINIVGANRKAFRLNGKKRIFELDHFLVKELDVAIKSKREVASLGAGACQGRIAPKMTKSEFLFVNGSPEKINNLVSGAEKIEEWVYIGKSEKPQTSYFFNRGRFYSWR